MSKKHAGGRPPKYTEDLPQRMLDYFNIEPFTVVDGKPVVQKFPSFARFSLMIDVTPQTLIEWQKELIEDEDGEMVLRYPEFSSTYKKCKAAQEAYLYECGLAGVIDKTVMIWSAKTILGHKEPDRNEVTVTVNNSLSDLVNNAANED